jgi:hypothetical protein
MRQFTSPIGSLAVLVLAATLLGVGLSVRHARSSVPAAEEFGGRSRFVVDHDSREGLLIVRGRFEVGIEEPVDEIREIRAKVRPVIGGNLWDPVIDDLLTTVTIPAGQKKLKYEFLRGYEVPKGEYQVLVSSSVPGKVVFDAEGQPRTITESENGFHVRVP